MTNRLSQCLNWLDADYLSPKAQQRLASGTKQSEYSRYLPLLFLHVGCVGLFWVGASPIAIGVAVFLYFFRMFAITAFYHRYFAHRAFKTSRAAQFVFALWALLSVQRGPLWWAAHHRKHHQSSDKPDDVHSPLQHGFWWAHVGWLTVTANMPTNYRRIADYAKFPELVFLNRFDWLMPLVLGLSLYGFGALLHAVAPQWGTNGLQMLVWGFFVSTTVLFHGTCSINSFTHLIGSKRFESKDESKNSLLLALVTMGEGWHNNHHRYPISARQGFYWWEIDMTYYILKAMAVLGLIWDLKPVPKRIYEEAQVPKLELALA